MKKPPDDLFKRGTPKRPAPIRLFKSNRSETTLGTLKDREERLVLSPEQRNCHSHVIGATGSGKSKFLEQLIRQDIENPNCGLCLVDPHGQLYNDIIHYVSHLHPRLAKRIVLFNTAGDLDQVLGFNPIPHHVDDIDTIANQLTSSVLKALGQDDQVSVPRISRWLKNIFYPLVANQLTLLEAFPFFSVYDASRRQDILKTIQSEAILSDWISFDKMSPKDRIQTIEGAANRLVHFLENRRIRNMIGQSAHALNFEQIMAENKILLVNLNGGVKIPHESTHLLGVFLVNELVRNAKLRDPDAKTTRPFHIYIDEFGQYVTRDIARALEECRKNKVFMTLAHQHLSQLKTEDEQLFNSVLTNCQNKYVFGGLSKNDADIMSEEMMTGYTDPYLLKDQIISTKVHHIEETRTTFSKSQSDAISTNEGGSAGTSHGEGANFTLNEGESFGVNQSDSQMRGQSHMTGRSDTENVTESVTNTNGTAETKGETINSSDAVSHGTNRQHTDTKTHSDTTGWSETVMENYNHAQSQSSGKNKVKGESRPLQGDGGSQSYSLGASSNKSDTVSRGGSKSKTRSGSSTDGISASEGYGSQENVTHTDGVATQSSEQTSQSTATQKSKGTGHTVSQSNTETENTGHSDGLSYAHQLGKSFGQSTMDTHQEGKTWGKADTHSESLGETTVPFLRPVEYQEVSSRTYFTTDEQLYAKMAEMKNQTTGNAFVRIGRTEPVQIEVDYVTTPYKSPRTSPQKVERFIEAVFKAHPNYYTPQLNVHEEYEQRHRALFSDGEVIVFGEGVRVIEHEEIKALSEPEIEDPFNP